MARLNGTDHPVLMFLELIGNDVCGAKSFAQMTSVADFKSNITYILQNLDPHLSKGSHLVTVGLADGEMLWNVMHNRTHPLGVKYEDVYAFMNCLDVSPCWGWMNSNATIRNMTQKHANELSAVYPELIKQYKFQNFDMAYYDFPFKQIMQEWVAAGGQAYQLVEPSDGFHPAQPSNFLGAAWFMKHLSIDHPEFIGDINPNNALIEKLFGNQGGYF